MGKADENKPFQLTMNVHAVRSSVVSEQKCAGPHRTHSNSPCPDTTTLTVHPTAGATGTQTCTIPPRSNNGEPSVPTESSFSRKKPEKDGEPQLSDHTPHIT